MNADVPYLLVVSELDPVARRVAERWGVPEATEDRVDGAPIRRLSARALLLKRVVRHVTDEHLDRLLPEHLRRAGTTLVFPSIHRSERNVPCLTVHPLGNPGASADVGGRAGQFTPADARLMADALRRLSERSREVSVPATYEATHHGPELGLPALFVEIGYGELEAPPPEAVGLLANILPHLERAAEDRVVLGVGGGHYAPHFTDLARRRRWAFGHILSRHALEVVDAPTALRAYVATPGAEGFVAARAEDAAHPALAGLGPRRRDAEAPVRAREGPATPGASGT
ncbi:MAG TPA: D-aminoacyl-tRNA deacylase [Thermoplasmata archaeon]|nr:D-aminoacyl-tRNA deacylase [Thermoplasmata archaeon]